MITLPKDLKPDCDYLIETDGTITEVYPLNVVRGYQLSELYEMLGVRIIEVCSSSLEGYILICDEEGKLTNEPKENKAATELYAHRLFDYIAGNALLCRSGQLQ